MLTTPVYSLPLTQDTDPAADVAAHMRALSNAVEAALKLGGVATPGATDLLTLAGRVNVLEGPPISVRALSTAATPLAATQFVALPLAQPAAGTDPRGFWKSTAPTRLTVPTGCAGLYEVSGTAGFASSSNAVQHFGQLSKNGVNVPGACASGVGTTINHLMAIPPTPVQLAVGDYIELTQYSGTAGTASTSAGQTPCLYLKRISS